MSAADFSQWTKEILGQTERALERALPLEKGGSARLQEAMRYSVLGGGKRIRPLLVFGAGELSGALAPDLEAAAVAVELIHAYSLVHDDLPCMDDDSLRRGKPTTHVQFGEAMAVLAGDALQCRAFEVLGQHSFSGGAEALLGSLRTLAEASGARGMAGGQAIDIHGATDASNLQALEEMHLKKTGALIRASVFMGLACGRPLEREQLGRLESFTRCLGLGFQVVDDILDVESPSENLGKTAGKDAAQKKSTFVTLLGVAAARRHASELAEEARRSLEPFGNSAQRLRELGALVFSRLSQS